MTPRFACDCGQELPVAPGAVASDVHCPRCGKLVNPAGAARRRSGSGALVGVGAARPGSRASGVRSSQRTRPAPEGRMPRGIVLVAAGGACLVALAALVFLLLGRPGMSGESGGEAARRALGRARESASAAESCFREDDLDGASREAQKALDFLDEAEEEPSASDAVGALREKVVKMEGRIEERRKALEDEARKLAEQTPLLASLEESSAGIAKVLDPLLAAEPEAKELATVVEIARKIDAVRAGVQKVTHPGLESRRAALDKKSFEQWRNVRTAKIRILDVIQSQRDSPMIPRVQFMVGISDTLQSILQSELDAVQAFEAEMEEFRLKPQPGAGAQEGAGRAREILRSLRIELPREQAKKIRALEEETRARDISALGDRVGAFRARALVILGQIAANYEECAGHYERLGEAGTAGGSGAEEVTPWVQAAQRTAELSQRFYDLLVETLKDIGEEG